MSPYFPKPYEPFGGDINVKVNLSNYTTKRDIKNLSFVDTSSFALKTNLANLKTEVDKLDIDKLVPVPVDLSKLNDIVKNDVVKKDIYNKLVAKVNATPLNNIDTSGFVLKTNYDTDKSELENKIPDTSGLVKKTDYNTKITEREGKIPNISNLATKTAFAALENKIPDVNNLATKTALTIVQNKMRDICNLATKTSLTTVENKIPDVNSLVKKQIITLKLLRLILSYQALMVKLLKIKMSLIKLKIILYYFFWGIHYLIVKMVLKLI